VPVPVFDWQARQPLCSNLGRTWQRVDQRQSRDSLKLPFWTSASSTTVTETKIFDSVRRRLCHESHALTECERVDELYRGI
jgi:hypothetical protein